MPLWFRIARIWLPITVAITVLVGVAYVGVQQSYRNGLDDPQLQLATDGRAALNSGSTPASLVTSPTVDADKSLAPFVIVYAADNRLLASGAVLGGSAPTPPAGVLAAARAEGINRVTWQPQHGVRIASVSAVAKDGSVVLAGRNMRAVEMRIDDLTRIVGVGWAAAVIGVLIVTVIIEFGGLRFSAGDSG